MSAESGGSVPQGQLFKAHRAKDEQAAQLRCALPMAPCASHRELFPGAKRS